jgi:transmembrane sensor
MTHGTSDPNQPAPTPDAEWEALARYVAGESSPDEAEAIRRLLSERRGDAALIGALDRALARLAVQASDDVDVEAALRQLKARRDALSPLSIAPRATPNIGRRHFVGSRVPTFAIAATAILAVGLLLWRSLRPGEQAAVAASTTIETTIGERDSVRLSDGTLVFLAPQSRVTIAAGYEGAHRTVDLSGEAFFDVAHDDTHPFVVRAGAAAIRDIGTAFTVREGARDSVVVIVTTGSVLLRAAATNSDSGVVLHAGDLGALGPDGRVVAQRGGGEKSSVLFSGGSLVFRDATMRQVADELHRWFGIRLLIADPTLAGRRLSATFTTETADQVLEVIRTALGAAIERSGDTVVVRAVEGGSRPR